jgi:hypothetical protein
VHFYAIKIHVDIFYGRLKLDATILTIIISKGAANFKLKFFQIDSFMNLVVKDQGRRPEEGGEPKPNQILLQEPVYVSSSNPKAKTLQEGDEHTNQHRRNDLLKVMNIAEKEWDQLDI